MQARTRNYGCVVYLESAPSNWKEILGEQKIPAFVSPLHDKDIDPQNQPKKPHWHVMIMYDSTKTVEQAKEVFAKIGGVGCEVIQSIRGYARYLCHLDNPEKAQYSPEKVQMFGGADYNAIIGLATDKYKAIDEMIEYVDGNNVRAYSDLLRYAKENRRDWFRLLCDNSTVVMKEYLKSKEWKRQDDLRKL